MKSLSIPFSFWPYCFYTFIRFSLLSDAHISVFLHDQGANILVAAQVYYLELSNELSCSINLL